MSQKYHAKHKAGVAKLRPLSCIWPVNQFNLVC